jgi:hypothetical protein
MVAVRWYLQSYRDVEELLAERGIAVDHVTITTGCGVYRSRTWCRGVVTWDFVEWIRRLVVFVDDTAEYSVASDGPVDRYGDWPLVVVGGVLVYRLVGPMIVVVPRVLGQGPGCVVVVVDQDSIGALSADGAHEPFGITVRSWCSRRRLDDCDVLAGEHPVECRRELGVSVTDEEAERGDPAC